MDLLGVGPLELIFFVVLLLVLFGPKDLAQGARQLGTWINRVTRSEAFRAAQTMREEISTLPQRMVQEAHLDEVQRDLHNQTIAPPATSSPPASADFTAWLPPKDPPSSPPPPTAQP